MKAETLMTMIDKQDRQDRRRAQRVGVAALEATGALDDLYARIDAGEVQLEGKDGLIQQLIKAGLERGLEAEAPPGGRQAARCAEGGLKAHLTRHTATGRAHPSAALRAAMARAAALTGSHTGIRCALARTLCPTHDTHARKRSPCVAHPSQPRPPAAQLQRTPQPPGVL